MQKEQMEVLNAVQQVLRHLTLVLAAEAKADLSRMSAVLAAAAHSPDLEPAARTMLEDLALGLGQIGGAGKTRN